MRDFFAFAESPTDEILTNLWDFCWKSWKSYTSSKSYSSDSQVNSDSVDASVLMRPEYSPVVAGISTSQVNSDSEVASMAKISTTSMISTT